MRFISSSPKHRGHFLLTVFLVIPFNCHTLATNQAISLFSFLEQHFMYDFYRNRSTQVMPRQLPSHPLHFTTHQYSYHSTLVYLRYR